MGRSHVGTDGDNSTDGDLVSIRETSNRASPHPSHRCFQDVSADRRLAHPGSTGPHWYKVVVTSPGGEQGDRKISGVVVGSGKGREDNEWSPFWLASKHEWFY